MNDRNSAAVWLIAALSLLLGLSLGQLHQQHRQLRQAKTVTSRVQVFKAPQCRQHQQKRVRAGQDWATARLERRCRRRRRAIEQAERQVEKTLIRIRDER